MRGSAGERSFAARFIPPLSLIALAVLVRLPFFDEPPGRDQGLFIAQAWQWLEGAALYEGIWEHKPGGIIALYALALELGGIGPTAIQFLHVFAGAATAIVLFAAARRGGLETVAATSAGFFYLLFFGGPLFGGFWATAQVEVFLDLPVALSLLLLLEPNREPARLRCFLAGILLGFATFGLKYSGLPLFALVFLCWIPGSQSVSGPATRAVSAALGFLLPAVALVFYFGVTDRLVDLWRATVEFNWAHRQIGAPAERLGIGVRLFPFFDVLWVLYGLTAWAFFSRVLFGKAGMVRDRLLVATAILFAAALAQVFLQGKFWVYHYHVIIIPLALGSAIGAQTIAQGWGSRDHFGRNLWAVLMLTALLLALFYGSVVLQYAQQHRLLEHLQNRIPDSEWQATYTWGGLDYDYAETLAAANQIQKTSDPGDRIFVWGFEPSLYWLAQRGPASRFLYDYPLSLHFEQLASRHRAELLGDFEIHPPEWIVVVSRDASDIESEDSDEQLKRHPELLGYLDRYYEPRWRLGDFTAYGRRDEPPALSP